MYTWHITLGYNSYPSLLPVQSNKVIRSFELTINTFLISVTLKTVYYMLS